MSGVNPVDYLADTLNAILDGHPRSHIEDLMLWRLAQMLFPSYHAPMHNISEKRLGQLAGALTGRAFAVRVSIHRFRDNVATEISETMPSGPHVATGVLGHRDAATTERHYDHSEGFRVATEFGDYVDGMRSSPVELVL